MNPTITSEPPAPNANGDNGDLARVAAALTAAARALLGGAEPPAVVFEAPRNADFGDFASNVALQLARQARRAPQALATELVEALFVHDPTLRELIAEITPVAGFINVRMAPAYWQRVARTLLREGPNFGRARLNGTKVSLEFGSANPTGPLGAVQGRTLSLGDSLAKAMRYCGFEVTTEWLTNDAGSQLDTLGRSLYARYRQLAQPEFPFPQDGYPGDYLMPIAQRVRDLDGTRWESAPETEWLPYFARFGRDTLVAEHQATCARFGVHYDNWQSEKALHESGAVERGITALRDGGLIYEQDGASWLRTTQFGDDKDRVVIRTDGRPTYLGADIPYNFEKLQRTDRAILILGPDHHGYIARLEALAAAFGRPGAIEVLISQQMTLQREGEIVSMSKRAGHVVTLDDILDEVGVDAARFFFVIPNPDSPMTFDLTLAKEQSSDNPVFYVQYGHARIASIERNAPQALLEAAARGESLERLTAPEELALIRRLAEFPATVRAVVEGRAPSRLARYARDVASDFHQFYMACKVLGDDKALSIARLGLARTAKTILAETLSILGVSAPERM
jgi:arginyl-tRNA synthetase